MQRLLVVDDEASIRTVLRGYLESEGFDVSEADSGDSALELARNHPFDLVLLDVMMPGTNGLDTMRRLRTFSKAFVILVTARADELDKLIGLEVGADDYITKPFSPREVVARVRAVLRRGSDLAREELTILRFDDLTINVDGRTVEVDGRPTELTSLEFDLLVALGDAPGRVYSRAQLLEKVWGYDFYGDERVVDVHIRALRAKLGDDATSPRFIATVRGVGYKFTGTRL
jgi:DNA-binding response OmpR family regulator